MCCGFAWDSANLQLVITFLILCVTFWYFLYVLALVDTFCYF